MAWQYVRDFGKDRSKMTRLEPADLYIRDRVSNGASYAEISSELLQFPFLGPRGLSLRSVRRYCNTNGCFKRILGEGWSIKG